MKPKFAQYAGVLLILALIAGIVPSHNPPTALAQSGAISIASECGLNSVASYLGDQIFGTIDSAVNEEKDKLIDKATDEATENILGTSVPVHDSKTKSEVKKEGKETQKEVKAASRKITFETCFRAITETIFKVALAKLKKRLLDRMTDDIIAWISDGRDPKFITNFGDFLEEAAQEAAGDTAREIGLAELCTPFKARIPPLLKPIPTFSIQASCTLDDIVKNIEGFYDDFSQGGPLAYAESWNPNNNLLGLLFATKDQVMKETAKKEEAAKLAATASGYRPVKRCKEWELRHYSGTPVKKNESQQLRANPVADTLGTNTPPSIPTDLTGARVRWFCSRTENTVPPALVGDFARVSVTADTQYITNADDLSPYVNAIFDAATNRIIKEGVKGLRGSLSNLQSESGTGRTPQQYSDNDRYRDYGSEYISSTNFIAQLKEDIRRQIPDARTKVATASITLTRLIALNRELIATSTVLSQCEISRDMNSGSSCDNTSSTLILARARTFQFTLDRSNLTRAFEGIAEVETELNNNQNLGASDLQTLASTLGAVQSYLATTITSQRELKELITQQLITTGQDLQACQLGSYSCSWTPPSP